jgi:hypothetical protein
MEHPILKTAPGRGIIKLPQRSESNVQVNLKSTEREVTKNAGAQQLHEVTPGSSESSADEPRGHFFFAFFGELWYTVEKDIPKGIAHETLQGHHLRH